MSSCVRITRVAGPVEVRTGLCEPFQIVLIVIVNTRGNQLVHGLRFQQSFFFFLFTTKFGSRRVYGSRRQRLGPPGRDPQQP